jgi:hypothetical protein
MIDHEMARYSIRSAPIGEMVAARVAGIIAAAKAHAPSDPAATPLHPHLGQR